VTAFSFSTESPSSAATGLLIVPVFEGPEPGPGVKETKLDAAYVAAKLTGKKGETLLVPKRPGDGFAAGAVLAMGVGKREEFSVTAMRRALGRAGSSARRFGTVATTFPAVFGAAEAEDAAQAAAEGLALGAYRFQRYRGAKDDGADLKKVIVLGRERSNAKAVGSAVKRAGVVVDAVAWARDLVNTPAGDLPPAALAKAAQKMAGEVGLTCKVWNEARPLALTGKGIAFDSGGLSIKDAASMESMKDDMGGAASIMATMKVIARLKAKINLVAAIPCAENMPSGSAQHPGDVIRHYGGKTSEVLNTDAEGRLVLADALAYLVTKRPQLIVDTATLTSACVIALGTDIAGVMANDETLAADLVETGSRTGEPMWQLPMFADYRSLIDSPVADIKNIGKRYGGAITAAWFLAEFVGDTPWCHLDIAGPAFSENGNDLGPKGATGVPVRTLVRFLLDRAASDGK
jgi:leucyl aminopeptidase